MKGKEKLACLKTRSRSCRSMRLSRVSLKKKKLHFISKKKKSAANKLQSIQTERMKREKKGKRNDTREKQHSSIARTLTTENKREKKRK